MSNQKDILVLINAPGAEFDYEILLYYAKQYNWRLSIEERLNPPKGWRGDGALVLSIDHPHFLRYIRRLRHLNIPVVDLELSKSAWLCNRCMFDVRGSSRLVAKHFKDLGFRQAAFFAMEPMYIRSIQHKIFSEVWGENHKSWILKKNTTDDWETADGYVKEMLMRAQKPIAVVTPNSYNAVRLLSICLKLGLNVPEEISIASLWYQAKFCEGRPIRISGVRFDETRRLRESLKLLARLVNGERGVPDEVLIPPESLEVLESSDAYASHSPILRKAFRYMRENLTQSFGAAEIASTLNTSRATLDRLFASEIGRSAGDEIKRMRIARAKSLLRTTNLKLDAVAQQCGFCHSSYLVRTFKSSTGITPHAYRTGATLFR